MKNEYKETDESVLKLYPLYLPTDKRKVNLMLQSYAKVNLFLDVLWRMESGYHEIVTLFSEINLYDSLKFSLTNYHDLKLLSTNNSLINKDNLIYRIAVYIQAKYSVRYGAKITLEKNIPIAAGLGGGSSNGAATICGLNWLWKLNMSETEMNEIAARFGSDINFFLHGGQAIGTGRGEKITPLTSDQYVDIDNILLVNPNFHISSNEAYALLGMKISESRPQTSESRPQKIATQSCQQSTLPHLLPPPQKGKLEMLLDKKDTQFCFNRLQAGICQKYPIIKETLDTIKSYGAKNAILSGSGPTMIGFFDDFTQCVKAQNHFNSLGYWTSNTTTIRRQKQ